MKQELINKLQEPFLESEIEWRVGSTNSDKTKGLALAYVTNRAIQNRLDEVFGIFGWKNEFIKWSDKTQLCGIAIKDTDSGEWITKYDGAENTDFEPTKGGLSDSMKRAAYQWGIGRYLYKLDAVWVSIKQQGKSYVIEKGCTPKLPSWALPKTSTTKPTENTANQSITEAQAKELTNICYKNFGKEHAKEYLKKLTGYNSTLEVPASEFEAVKKMVESLEVTE